jgi:hypothetical protein
MKQENMSVHTNCAEGVNTDDSYSSVCPLFSTQQIWSSYV